MQKNDTSTGRKLNMEEKRKLERLLLNDIDATLEVHRIKRSADREQVAKSCTTTVPTEAKALFDLHEKARAEVDRTESQLRALGYSINGYGKDRAVGIGYGILPKKLQAFDDDTRQTQTALNELKRTYTLKLFAGGDEARDLFASLAKELAAITK